MSSALAPFREVAFDAFGAPTTVGELLAFATGALSVWLVVRKSIWTFPVGIANVVFLGLLFFDSRLYADAALQVVYVLLQAIGWWAWLRAGANRSRLTVTRDRRALAMTIGAVLVVTAALTPILVAVDDSAPFWDAHTTALSFGAQALLSFKRLENWYLWIAADLIYIPLYLSKELLLTAIVYVLFLGLCVLGVRSWRAAAAAPAAATPAAAAAGR